MRTRIEQYKNMIFSATSKLVYGGTTFNLGNLGFKSLNNENYYGVDCFKMNEFIFSYNDIIM